MALMGITAYAAHRSCHLQAVQKAIAAGRIRVDENNLIDSEIADRDWDKNTDQSHQTTGAAAQNTNRKPDEPVLEAEPGISYRDARALREVVEVQRRQFELELRRKQVASDLVRREDVEAEAFRLYRRLRDACLNIPSRLAAQLAAETDEHVVFETLDEEVRRVFSEFAEGRLT